MICLLSYSHSKINKSSIHPRQEYRHTSRINNHKHVPNSGRLLGVDEQGLWESEAHMTKRTGQTALLLQSSDTF